MADTFNNRELARDEWRKTDADYKVAALVIAECILKFGDVAPARLDDFRAAKQAERAAWGRYQEIVHAGEEVNALGTTGKLKLDVDKEESGMKIGDRVKLRELVDGQVWDNGHIVSTYNVGKSTWFRVRWTMQDGSELTTSSERPEDLELSA